MTPARLPSSCARGLAGALLAVALLVACGDTPAPLAAKPFSRVLVIGVDGLEWDVLLPLMAAGRCSHLAALAERGSFGLLGTFVPTFSPVVWTSIATGKRMEDHGITHFWDAEHRAFTSSRRRGRALWNIADRYGLSSNTVGWWMTWPVEMVKGAMVSGTSAEAQIDKNWKPALMPGVPDQVWPPDLEPRVLALAAEVGRAENVGRLAREHVFRQPLQGVLDADEQKLVDQTMWSVLSDATYFAVAQELLRTQPADLNLVYFGGPDVVGHRFWRQARPEGFAYAGSSPAADAALAGVLDDTYVWIDEMIGELLATVGPDTTVFVVSDHGMHAVAQQEPQKDDNTGNHQDGTPGVIIAAGPGIRVQGGLAEALQSGALPIHGSVLALPPTLLGLLGIPGARDMAARAYKNLLTDEARARLEALELVETHDEGFREPSMDYLPPEAEQQYLERMGEIGYLDLAPQAVSRPVDPASFVEPKQEPQEDR